MNAEIWKPVPGWESFYEISTLGRVRSVSRLVRSFKGTKRIAGRSVSAIPHKRTGYLVVNFTNAGNRKQMQVHSLVLNTFVGPCPDGYECRHLNGDPHDNKLSNLAWGTKKENTNDKRGHGTMPLGEKHHNSVLTVDDVLWIRSVSGSDSKKGKILGVSKSTVQAARTGRLWGHV